MTWNENILTCVVSNILFYDFRSSHNRLIFGCIETLNFVLNAQKCIKKEKLISRVSYNN